MPISSNDNAPSLQQAPSARALLKEIYAADSPERFTQNLPVQTVYLLLQHQGVESSSELLALASDGQYKLLLDFDLWQNDSFDEAALWRWFEAIDEEGSLDPIIRLIERIDPYLLALVMARHTEVLFFEETTDQPPDMPFYTPDNGHTWVHIHIKEPRLHKMMGKLLAVLFENTPDFFYKLAGMPKISTNTALEESSYVSKCRRLGAEDIPEAETAWAFHRPLTPEAAALILNQGEVPAICSSTKAIQPLVYDGALPRPLSELVQEVSTSNKASDREEFERQLTHIANSGLVRFGVMLNDVEEVALIMSKIRGTLNLGLETALGLCDLPLRDAYNRLNLAGLYQLGLHALHTLRLTVLKISEEDREASEKDQALALLLSSSSMQFPELPEFFKSELSLEGDSPQLSTKRSPFEHCVEIEAIYELLDEHFGISPE